MRRDAYPRLPHPLFVALVGGWWQVTLIAAIGFVIFAISSVGVNYWSGLFSGFVVLGLGMAICGASLTSVVMDSVQQDRAGTTSGLNNAVARLAAVLAMAVLGT